jgi:type II secretion system protein G
VRRLIHARKNERGFTLIELLVVVAILGVLAVVAVPRVMTAIDDAKNNKGKSDLAIIGNALERHYFATGEYPTNLNDLKGEYLKNNFAFTNGYAKVYYYIYAPTTGTVKYYIVADPGQSPSDPPEGIAANGVGAASLPAITWTTYVSSGY